MRQVTIPKPLYDDVIYPAIAFTSPPHGTDFATLTVLAKLLEALQAVGQPTPEVPACKACGRPAQPKSYRMKDLRTDMKFEDAHADHLFVLLEGQLSGLANWRAVELLPILQALKPVA